MTNPDFPTELMMISLSRAGTYVRDDCFDSKLYTAPVMLVTALNAGEPLESSTVITVLSRCEVPV